MPRLEAPVGEAEAALPEARVAGLVVHRVLRDRLRRARFEYENQSSESDQNFGTLAILAPKGSGGFGLEAELGVPDRQLPPRGACPARGRSRARARMRPYERIVASSRERLGGQRAGRPRVGVVGEAVDAAERPALEEGAQERAAASRFALRPPAPACRSGAARRRGSGRAPGPRA